MNIQKVGVVGAGMMGSEIALCFARKGYVVYLADINMEFAEKGKKNIVGILDKGIKKGKIEEIEKTFTLEHLFTTDNYNDLQDCDIVIEAVLEKLDLKLNVFSALDKICKKETIFASNTSSISITKLAGGVSKERASVFVGTHFNSPASVMKLVEVIPGYLSADDMVNTVTELLKAVDKVPVRVKDVTGFALNRLFHVFYTEACRLVEEGVCTPEDVDKICLYGLGHPMGIFKLLDITGHDLNLMVDQILFDAYGDRFRPSPQIQRLVDSGRFGRKSKHGFYDYE